MVLIGAGVRRFGSMFLTVANGEGKEPKPHVHA